MVTLFLVAFFVAVDQLSKYLVTLHLAGKEAMDIIPGFLQFYYLENRGAAFGILQEQRFLFIVITLVVILFILYGLFKYKHPNRSFYWALILILSGTIGNFIDRIRLHYVVDFFKTNIFGYQFAIFNVADICIVCGTILLMFHILFSEETGKKKERTK